MDENTTQDIAEIAVEETAQVEKPKRTRKPKTVKTAEFHFAQPVRGEVGHCTKYLDYSTPKTETKAFREQCEQNGLTIVKKTPTVTRVLMVRYEGTPAGIQALYDAAHSIKTRVRKMTNEVIYLDGVKHTEIAKIAADNIKA